MGLTPKEKGNETRVGNESKLEAGYCVSEGTFGTKRSKYNKLVSSNINSILIKFILLSVFPCHQQISSLCEQHKNEKCVWDSFYRQQDGSKYFGSLKWEARCHTKREFKRSTKSHCLRSNKRDGQDQPLHTSMKPIAFLAVSCPTRTPWVCKDINLTFTD